MVALANLSGQRFGRLAVIARMPTIPKRHTRWLCECDCGVRLDIDGACLRAGVTRSCGCIRVETTTERSVTHSDSRHGHRAPEYTAWLNMRNRCSGKHPQSRAAYSDRGIRVCAEWQDNYEAFLAHVGRKPGPEYSLDRIDVNGHYEPGNVRWATQEVQAANTRRALAKAA